jgi:hypothetical protein
MIEVVTNPQVSATPTPAPMPVIVNTQAEYDKLPIGTVYQDSQGKVGRKSSHEYESKPAPTPVAVPTPKPTPPIDNFSNAWDDWNRRINKSISGVREQLRCISKCSDGKALSDSDVWLAMKPPQKTRCCLNSGSSRMNKNHPSL